VIVHHDPVVKHRGTGGAPASSSAPQQERRRSGRGNGQNGNGGNGNGSGGGSSNGNGGSASSGNGSSQSAPATKPHGITDDAKNALAKIAASTIATHTGAVNIITQEQSDAAKASSTATVEAPPASSEGAEPAETPQATPDAVTVDTQAPSRGRKGSRRARQAKPVVETEAGVESEPTASETVAPPAVIELPAIEILDIPVAKAPAAQRRISNRDAEVLLDSVLGALPEPKQPGQGRSRSRRVSTAALSAPTPEQQ
jgi:ribonuclease E